ncbi:hypothetical protein [Sphingomonas fennica]|uniref:hypothetical protein n=1 Tax=Edaphosphingomonas fennica TaxID=114404 RepID=UPI001474F996|nr:hypothetical protein [Sphingomonas fennica]
MKITLPLGFVPHKRGYATNCKAWIRLRSYTGCPILAGDESKALAPGLFFRY